jgi:PhzF family phenazine biosynthesis protein
MLAKDPGIEENRSKNMEIPLYQVDAFTAEPFRGNPAAVCPLEEWLPDDTLQAIAMENGLSETAFFVSHEDRYDLRWFTPTIEVDLCGHATLAAAYMIFEKIDPARDKIRFQTRSGPLAVERDEDRIALVFPSRPAVEGGDIDGVADALGARPRELLAARDYLAVFDSEEEVRKIAPYLSKILKLGCFAICVTAPGDDCDFVSRFFAPAAGVPEDPVTGSAHCTLIPYWSARIGKKKLFARQVSRRGGELYCEDRGSRVRIAGHAVCTIEGKIRF